ncbi:DUF4783 domain-containing protein [Algoriphagus marinus]|uniref:DUF4783 domain-containing protein n=1 Tax=Algoriphagus marinus TaxID=1925762 RepID=UPI0009FB1C45|nr:DUF4783 domain-containing protein [Algoriphagus marinus]
MTLTLSLFLSVFLYLQPIFGDEVKMDSIDPVISAIDGGSSGDLAKFFDTSISLNVNGQQGEYSKNQAEIVIKDFFKKNPSLGFKVVFRSETNPSLISYIGDYQSTESSYKVFIRVSQQGENLKIYSLDFVKA